ncbi:NADPH:quinone reductase [Micractinium conductrix]|uniref:NADPH:quinone reductase n=1 Tax=Micractinium conductrix TaxID=554055 RepID=A0A2P6V5M4_9CHLO|nr:NADPH:quinone reductase [Micractinium conductrix]|eukprot:PSC69384.1 NADPH:quinone reductase [Micractinium conductrix]
MAPCRRGAGAALVALLACASVAAAAAAPARRGLGEGGSDWGAVSLVNTCPWPVAVKAGYSFIPGDDDGHACPNRAEGSEFAACATKWITVAPNGTASLPDLPTGVWSYSAFVVPSAPRHWLSGLGGHLDAMLANTKQFNEECTQAGPDCVWWAVPALSKTYDELVLSCEDYNPAALPEEPELFDVTVVNNCSEAVRVKFAYQISENDTADGCVLDSWFGDERRCITDWQSLEPGDEAYVGATVDPGFWTYGAHIVGDEGYDLAKRARGAFQGTNETTACPEEDAYGSGYVCEWWAPKCFFCNAKRTADEPLVLTCDGYKAAAR